METMAIETKTMVEPGIIKMAMGKMGLKERAEELLDLLHEMQIKRDLKLSWEECQRGECGDVFEAMKEIKKELKKDKVYFLGIHSMRRGSKFEP